MADNVIDFELKANAQSALNVLKTVGKTVEGLTNIATAGSIGGALGGASSALGFGGAFAVANTAINAIPGANQIGGLLKDSFLANSQGIYAKADAIGNAYERTQQVIGLAGSDIDPNSARDIFQQFKSQEMDRVQANIDLKEKLGPEVMKELADNAKKLPEAFLEDIAGILQGIWDWLKELPFVKNLTG